MEATHNANGRCFIRIMTRENLLALLAQFERVLKAEITSETKLPLAILQNRY